MNFAYELDQIERMTEAVDEGILLGKDCCGQNIVPNRDKISVHTNRHTETSGEAWGWIEGCTLNICWSDKKDFNKERASALVNAWNRWNA